MDWLPLLSFCHAGSLVLVCFGVAGGATFAVRVALWRVVGYKNKGDDSVRVPPLPIPNREVKPHHADGTAKVGE